MRWYHSPDEGEIGLGGLQDAQEDVNSDCSVDDGVNVSSIKYQVFLFNVGNR